MQLDPIGLFQVATLELTRSLSDDDDSTLEPILTQTTRPRMWMEQWEARWLSKTMAMYRLARNPIKLVLGDTDDEQQNRRNTFGGRLKEAEIERSYGWARGVGVQLGRTGC
jgi:hypothetical protein